MLIDGLWLRSQNNVGHSIEITLKERKLSYVIIQL